MDIIAIDVGTASVSAALARKGREASEILAVLRQPFDLLNPQHTHGHDARAAHIMRRALANIFQQVHTHMPHPTTIYISFSGPFFEELEIQKTIERSIPDRPIDAKEQKEAFQLLQEEASHSNKNLQLIKGILTYQAINGYPVDNSFGFHGKILELKGSFLFLSSFLKKALEEEKETFFPKIPCFYYSDVSLLHRAVSERTLSPFPALILDVGGEITTVVLATSHDLFQSISPLFVGMRTIERHLASLLSISQTHAEALIKQYSTGVLDEAEKKRIAPILTVVLDHWWQEIQKKLGTTIHLPISVIVSGAGRDFLPLTSYLERLAKEQKFSVTPLVIPFDTLLSPRALAEGKDTILSLLLLYAGA